MADELTQKSIYDSDGNIQIPLEAVVDKVSADFAQQIAQKTYENAQLKVVIEMLQKELQGIQNLVK